MVSNKNLPFTCLPARGCLGKCCKARRQSRLDNVSVLSHSDCGADMAGGLKRAKSDREQLQQTLDNRVGQ